MVKYLTADRIFHSTETVPQRNTAIVFGGLYYESQPLTETNRERLLAAKVLLDQNKVDTVVVSNTEQASTTMKKYLLELGAEEQEVLIDPKAVTTLDTCKKEGQRAPEDSPIFISHGYHLPRILLQCGKEGVVGVGFAPDKLNLIKREDMPEYQKWQIRFLRTQREAFFTITSLLGIY